MTTTTDDRITHQPYCQDHLPGDVGDPGWCITNQAPITLTREQDGDAVSLAVSLWNHPEYGTLIEMKDSTGESFALSLQETFQITRDMLTLLATAIEAGAREMAQR